MANFSTMMGSLMMVPKYTRGGEARKERRHRDRKKAMTIKTRFATGGLMLGYVLLPAGFPGEAAAQVKPEGEMRWALYVPLSPVWFDPGEVVGQITPFWVLYALHDALVKPMPGNQMTPSLAESWTVSADQRAYE